MVPVARSGAVILAETGSAAASKIAGLGLAGLRGIFGRGASSVAGPSGPGPAPAAANGPAPAATTGPAATTAPVPVASTGQAIVPGPAAVSHLASAPSGAPGISYVTPSSAGISFSPPAVAATSGVVRGARATGPGTRVGELPRTPLPAQGPRAPPRPGNRYTEESIKDLTPKEMRALLEELGSTRTFPPGTRATTMLPVLREALVAADRMYVVPAATRNAQRVALNQTIPRTAPELATPVNIQTPTPIGDKVRASAETLAAQNGGVSAGDAERLFRQATEDSAILVDEVIPLSGRNLLTPIPEAGGRTARQAIIELPASGEELVSAAQAEAILDSIFPARVVGRALEIGSPNLAQMEAVYRGRMPARNVQEYNEQMRDLVAVSLQHIPAWQVDNFTRVFTPDRLRRLKAALGTYFLRNPLDARLILDELIAIIPRGQRNGAQYTGEIIDTLISNLNLQPARALAELVRTSAALGATELEVGAAGRLAYSKGMGWFGSRAFYSLIASGLGIIGLFLAAYANITSVEDLAREIRIGRDVFDARFPGIAEFRDRVALFFQGIAANLLDVIYDTTGMERPAQAPAAAQRPPEVVRPPAEVWEWARYIGEYSRMLRELTDIVIGARNRPIRQ